MSSLFISLEGGEGAGKSTQAKLLEKFLHDQGYQVILTREPGGTNLGTTIRQLFLQGETLTPITELFLLLSDRSHHVQQLIKPALGSKIIVITDRYVDSTLAYQGFGHGINRDWIIQLNHYATQGIMPDLTFWLDIEPEIGLERALAKNPHRDRMEKFTLEFHHRVRLGFENVWQNHPGRVKRIDGTKAPEQVSANIQAIVRERLGVK